jgi:hypothetical protein
MYKAGDRSILPVLLRFTYLTDFYDEALLRDPDGFLSAIGALPEKDQIAVAFGISGGGGVRTLQKARFEAVRSLLIGVSNESPTRKAADTCLRVLEANNASLFLDYFPPQTFVDRGAAFRNMWYSRELNWLGEMPLSSANSLETTYRLTFSGPFNGTRTVRLTILPDGSGIVRIKSINATYDALQVDDPVAITSEQVATFTDGLNNFDFWHTPTTAPGNGLDGAEWILEGVHDGQYHVAARWCPGIESHSLQTLAFARAARLLLELAGHKYGGDC